jgi:hypothetical protein
MPGISTPAGPDFFFLFDEKWRGGMKKGRTKRMDNGDTNDTKGQQQQPTELYVHTFTSNNPFDRK